MDETLSSVSSTLAEKTTNYVVLMVAPESAVATNVYVEPLPEPEIPSDARFVRNDVLQQNGNATNPPTPTGYDTFFTPQINEALIISVLLLIILSVARTGPFFFFLRW